MCNACCCSPSACCYSPLFLHVTLLPIFFFPCLSVSWLHLSHIFFLLSLDALVSLYHTSLSVPLYFLSLLCLACFMDCRLKSPGQRNCRASACPSLPVTYGIETAVAEQGKRNKYHPFISSHS